METKRTAVVTGATSGLGEAAAVALAKRGFRVLLVGRDVARGADVVSRAQAEGGEAEFLTGDLFTIAGVRRLAGEIRRRSPELHLLVNNAGGAFGAKELTEDGLERTFALNVMAPFALTEALLPELTAARGRVVNLVTGIPRRARATLAQLTGDKSAAGIGSYSRSKLALVAVTKEQQRRHGARGVTFVSLHPGIIPGTRFGVGVMPAFLLRFSAFVAKLLGLFSSPAQAAARYLLVGTGEVKGGGFYNQGKLAPAPLQADEPAFAAEVWAHLEGLGRPRAAREVHGAMALA